MAGVKTKVPYSLAEYKNRTLVMFGANKLNYDKERYFNASKTAAKNLDNDYREL